ncbi:hypothetical protein CLPU_6c01710 [Gottschalkia purinilytica]|uniref:O-methyltransferase dimerisation domain-containing protein n=1 Tax=Gottschalkia purinilytica TaxID=1503 RepID=A0A0L0WBG4_GOTPU|nr:methyltransferase dimerization domain-containing protein [Gottschalkia purinilytica]KNF08685.1 hypothetical protein CLPU_6c01710 [Gottschalkia purinilytica]
MNRESNLVDIVIPEKIEIINNLTESFKAHQVLIAALEVGLFDWIYENGESTREEIIEGIKINGMFSRSFLSTLLSLGFLQLNSDKYTNTEVTNKFLVSKSKYYQGNWIKRNTGSSSKWNNLKDNIIAKEENDSTSDDNLELSLIKGLQERSLRGELQNIVGHVTSWNGFSKSKKILDMGDEYGLYSIALSQLNSNLTGTILSNSHDIKVTEKYIAKYNLANKLKILQNDATSNEIDANNDIVLVSHSLYKHRKKLGDIFDNINKLLKEGGLAVFNHWFCGPGCGSSNGLKELDKSLFSGGHPLCHSEKFAKLLEDYGFELIKTLDIPSYNGISKLHMAIKIKE